MSSKLQSKNKCMQYSIPFLKKTSQCTAIHKYSPKLLGSLLQDSQVSLNKNQSLIQNSKISQNNQLNESSIKDRYDEIFRQNLKIYKKLQRVTSSVSMAIQNIRFLVSIFIKQLMETQNLNQNTESIVQQFLVQILRTCAQVQESNFFPQKNNNTKLKHTNTNLQQRIDKNKIVTNFTHNSSHILIDQFPDNDQQIPQSNYDNKNQVSQKLQQLQLIEEEEDSKCTYGSNYGSDSSLLVRKQIQSEVNMPISSQKQANHSKSIIDHFYGKIDRMKRSHNNISQITNNQSQSHNLLKDKEQSVSEQIDQNCSQNTFSEDYQSQIEDENDIIPSVSAFQSRLPNREYKSFYDQNPINQSSNSQRQRVFPFSNNKQNIPHETTINLNIQQSNMDQFSKKYIQSYVLSRKKIFNP